MLEERTAIGFSLSCASLAGELASLVGAPHTRKVALLARPAAGAAVDADIFADIRWSRILKELEVDRGVFGEHDFVEIQQP